MQCHTKSIKKHHSFAKSSPQNSKPPLLRNGAKTKELLKNINIKNLMDEFINEIYMIGVRENKLNTMISLHTSTEPSFFAKFLNL